MDTAAVDSWCSAIELQAELPSDELLVQLIRIQKLAQTISLTIASASAGGAVPAAALLAMVVHGFQQQLQAFRSGLPAHFRHNSKFFFFFSLLAPCHALCLLLRLVCYCCGLSSCGRGN